MAAEEASTEHFSRTKTPGEVNGIYILEYLVSSHACNILNDKKTGFNCLIPYYYYYSTSSFHGNISMCFSFRISPLICFLLGPQTGLEAHFGALGTSLRALKSRISILKLYLQVIL